MRSVAFSLLHVQEAIMKPLDDKNLDLDVPYFADAVRWVSLSGLGPQK